jgi:hypothetical protein
MTESGIAELRRLLRTRSDSRLRTYFFCRLSQPAYQDACNWLVASRGPWGEQINALTPAELRQVLEFVLYAETDK